MVQHDVLVYCSELTVANPSAAGNAKFRSFLARRHGRHQVLPKSAAKRFCAPLTARVVAPVPPTPNLPLPPLARSTSAPSPSRNDSVGPRNTRNTRKEPQRKLRAGRSQSRSSARHLLGTMLFARPAAKTVNSGTEGGVVCRRCWATRHPQTHPIKHRNSFRTPPRGRQTVHFPKSLPAGA